jgi:hypothetical protein
MDFKPRRGVEVTSLSKRAQRLVEFDRSVLLKATWRL